ncbi:hypothetical protein AAY473_036725 [Plecturocebus cupreus]
MQPPPTGFKRLSFLSLPRFLLLQPPGTMGLHCAAQLLLHF